MSSFMTYRRFLNKSNTTGANSGTRTTYSSVDFSSSQLLVRFQFIYLSLSVCVLWVIICPVESFFFIVHFIVCSPIYSLWLLLWYFKTEELLTLPEHMSSPPGFSEVRVTRSLALYICFVDRCLYFFFWPLCCLFFFDIRIAPLLSFNSSY